MRRSLLLVALAVGMMVAWSVGRVQGQGEGKVVFAAADRADYKPTTKGVSTAAVWGDSATGAHGTWTKFDPGYDAGMHTHTNEGSIGAGRGAYWSKDDAGENRE